MIPDRRVTVFAIVTVWGVLSLLWALLNIAFAIGLGGGGKAVYAGVTGAIALGCAIIVFEHATAIYNGGTAP